MSGRSSSPRHLFVDDRAEVLERWEQAFAGARAEPLAAAKKILKAGGGAAVWVRLPAKKLALRRLRAVVDAAAAVPVLVLADAPDEEQALELLAMGARAYVNTHATALVLQRAWSSVEAGGLWVGEALTLRLVRAAARAGTDVDALKSIIRNADVSDRFCLARSLVSVISARSAPPVADRRR